MPFRAISCHIERQGPIVTQIRTIYAVIVVIGGNAITLIGVIMVMSRLHP